MLAWGKSLLNVKSCVSPTGPDHSKNRETVFLDHCHQTGPVSGDRRGRNVCQTIKCPKCGTHLPVGSRLNPFRNLGSLGGWTLGSTNVEGGLHSPSSPKIINYYAHPHRNLYWLEALHQLMDKYGAVEPVQNLWASSTFLGSKTTQPLETYSRSEQPILSETIRTTLQQWEWVTSIDFKDAYFHIPIQEQSRTSSKHCLSVCPLHPWSPL